MDSDSDYECDSESDSNETEYLNKCPICLINSIVNPEIRQICAKCKITVCMTCIMVIDKKIKVGECINCFNKECMECVYDISEQMEKFIENNEVELPLDVVDDAKILNCEECYKKYYT